MCVYAIGKEGPLGFLSLAHCRWAVVSHEMFLFRDEMFLFIYFILKVSFNHVSTFLFGFVFLCAGSFTCCVSNLGHRPDLFIVTFCRSRVISIKMKF